MNRLIKKTAASVVCKATETASKLIEVEKEIAKLAESWAGENFDSAEDASDLHLDFVDKMIKNPDIILEAIIDYIPEDISEEQIYKADKADKEEAIDFLLSKYDSLISGVMNKIFKDEEYIKNETKPDNSPFGPGMKQTDFI